MASRKTVSIGGKNYKAGSKAANAATSAGGKVSTDKTQIRANSDASKAATKARGAADPLVAAENRGETVPSYIPPPTLNSANLTPTTGINLPTPPAPGTTGTEAMTSLSGLTNVAGPDIKQADSDFKSYLKGIMKPESSEKIYNKTVKDVDLLDKQRSVANYQAQLNAITTKAQADKLSLVGQGRGVTDVIIGGQQAKIDREAAIQALPVSAQLAAAQGDLEMAQTHLETLFRIRSEDAQNKLDYANKVNDAVYNYASEKQKTALDAKKTADERNFTLMRDNLSYARDLASTAIENGQPSVAAAIMSLDPNSKTYAQDIANSAKRITVDQGGGSGSGTVEERKAGAISTLQGYLQSGQPLKNGNIPVDKNGFITPEAWNLLIDKAPSEGIDRKSFIQEFGYRVYMDPKTGVAPAYRLTPAEQKLIKGEL